MTLYLELNNNCRNSIENQTFVNWKIQ
uniref:Uncharacterized protein n=1 Tax=Rhizophora mucronata TaxID=61149 RepID=A0A2P2IHX4_RHIMU